MRIVVALLALFLGGCIYTAPELVEAGTRFDHTSTATSRAVANCIGRNAEQGGFQVSVLESTKENAHTVSIRIPGAIGAFAYGEVDPASSGGAHARLYVISYNLDPAGSARRFLNGC